MNSSIRSIAPAHFEVDTNRDIKNRREETYSNSSAREILTEESCNYPIKENESSSHENIQNKRKSKDSGKEKLLPNEMPLSNLKSDRVLSISGLEVPSNMNAHDGKVTTPRNSPQNYIKGQGQQRGSSVAEGRNQSITCKRRSSALSNISPPDRIIAVNDNRASGEYRKSLLNGNNISTPSTENKMNSSDFIGRHSSQKYSTLENVNDDLKEVFSLAQAGEHTLYNDFLLDIAVAVPSTRSSVDNRGSVYTERSLGKDSKVYDDTRNHSGQSRERDKRVSKDESEMSDVHDSDISLGSGSEVKRTTIFGEESLSSNGKKSEFSGDQHGDELSDSRMYYEDRRKSSESKRQSSKASSTKSKKSSDKTVSYEKPPENMSDQSSKCELSPYSMNRAACHGTLKVIGGRFHHTCKFSLDIKYRIAFLDDIDKDIQKYKR